MKTMSLLGFTALALFLQSCASTPQTAEVLPPLRKLSRLPAANSGIQACSAEIGHNMSQPGTAIPLESITPAGAPQPAFHSDPKDITHRYQIDVNYVDNGGVVAKIRDRFTNIEMISYSGFLPNEDRINLQFTTQSTEAKVGPVGEYVNLSCTR